MSWLPFDDLKTAILYVGFVDGQEDRQVLDVFNVRVGYRVDVRSEAACLG